MNTRGYLVSIHGHDLHVSDMENAMNYAVLSDADLGIDASVVIQGLTTHPDHGIQMTVVPIGLPLAWTVCRIQGRKKLYITQ